MNVLIIKNIAAEGPGTIEDYLRARKTAYSVVDLSQGETAPDPDPFTHVVIMGGPMAVYEMDQHPFLKDEAGLIGRAIGMNKRVLGVCLGAQMIAHVLGARVYAGGAKEIGWSRVAITPDGIKDPLMAALAVDGGSIAEVFQWHGDTFDLPAGAVLLASSQLFPHQAFRYSDRVYALQFHIEVTPVIVQGWLKDEQGIDLNSVDAESNRIYDPYRQRADGFYRGFFS
ncbi:MAG TPA: amidotransferase [Nitrospirota bacterium]|nr:amidotransferase [Nitrospirota bacterium]